MIVEIQCLPSPAGTPAEPYRHIDAAIAIVEHSGLHFEVGALGTTFEGEPEAAWALARRVHEACLAAGALSCVTIVKVAQAASSGAGPTMDGLTGKFRE